METLFGTYERRMQMRPLRMQMRPLRMQMRPSKKNANASGGLRKALFKFAVAAASLILKALMPMAMLAVLALLLLVVLLLVLV